MLTDRQRRRCAQIAGALDAGNLGLWLENEASLSVREKALVWDLRQHVAAKRKQQDAVPSKRPAPPKVQDDQDDLGPQGPGIDDWPEPAPDDDDSPPQQEWTTCRVCRGLGRLKDGSLCSVCNGSGRILADQDDSDDDWPEEELFRYEFESEE
jgi:hypothetical protein